MLAAVIALHAADGEGRIENRGNARRFVSQKYGFSMPVPLRWGVSTRLDTPVYFYSTSSRSFGQFTFPKGGAVITVTAHDSVSGKSKAAETPSKWAIAEANSSSSDSPSVAPFEMPKESRASGAVELSYNEDTFSPEQQAHHLVAVFWEFNGELFGAQLSYVSDDPNGPTLEKLFLETVKGIRPLESGNKHP